MDFSSLYELPGINAFNIPDKNGDTITHKLLKNGSFEVIRKFMCNHTGRHFDLNVKDRNGKTGFYILVTTKQNHSTHFSDWNNDITPLIVDILENFQADITITGLNELKDSDLAYLNMETIHYWYAVQEEFKQKSLRRMLTFARDTLKITYWVLTYKREEAVAFYGAMKIQRSKKSSLYKEPKDGIRAHGNIFHILAYSILTNPYATMRTIEAVRLMASYGVDVNALNEDGHTPIQLAVFNLNRSLMLAFMENGADYDLNELLEIAKHPNPSTHVDKKQDMIIWIKSKTERVNSAISWIALNNRNALRPKLSDHARANVVELL